MSVPKPARSAAPSNHTLPFFRSEKFNPSGLRYEPAMQFPEIAQAMGLSVENVKYIYRKAMRKIAAQPGIHEMLALASMAAKLRDPAPLRMQRRHFVTACAALPSECEVKGDVL